MKRMTRVAFWAAGALAALLAIAVALPFLYPISRHIPELAALAGEKLGQPVAIGSLELRMFPTPRVVAGDVTVGKKQDVTIGELEIVPELAALLAGTKSVRLIRAERVTLKETALSIPAGMPKSEGGEPVAVKRVSLRKVTYQKFPEFDLDAWLGENYRVERARLDAPDTELLFRLDPDGQTAAKFGLNGKLYGGSVAGEGRAEWTKQWQLGGKMKLDGVNLGPLQQALGKKPKLVGRLRADTTYSARARAPELLVDALVVEGPFEVIGGAYQGYDLSRLSLGKLPAGGATKFEELKGKVQSRGKQLKLADLCARSPVLIAGGNVEVAADQKLSGKLDVSVSKTGGFVGIPVQLSGTTNDPSIMPSKGYLIGAAVGTVLLPGIGTSIGSSVGSRIEGKSDCK
jgi:uncharacterized protein involved in outer membrane biogenesis